MYYKGGLTSSIDLAQVGEAPDVAQTYSEFDASEQVLNFVVPLGSLVSGAHAFTHPCA